MYSFRCADKAHEVWWKEREEEAEILHDAAVRLKYGGSLLNDVKLLKSRQNLNADSRLLAHAEW